MKTCRTESLSKSEVNSRGSFERINNPAPRPRANGADPTLLRIQSPRAW